LAQCTDVDVLIFFSFVYHVVMTKIFSALPSLLSWIKSLKEPREQMQKGGCVTCGEFCESEESECAECFYARQY